MRWFWVLVVLVGCADKAADSCDCRSDEICVGGECLRICNTEAECAGSDVCSGGVCRAGVAECEGDCPECTVDEECTSPSGRPDCVSNAACLQGACVYTYAADTVCEAASCTAGVIAIERVCGDDGACESAGTQSCDGYGCASNGPVCRNSCALPADCAAGYDCDTPQCIPNGSPTVTTSSFTATPTTPIPSDGVAAATLTIVLRDGQNLPVAGVALTLQSTGGAVVGTPPATDGQGETQTTLTATSPGDKQVSVSSPAGLAALGITVTFVGAALDLRPSGGEIGVDDFGEVFEDTTRNYTVKNIGAVATSALTITLEGDDGDLFEIEPAEGSDCVPATTTLAANAECSIRLTLLGSSTPTLANLDAMLVVEAGALEISQQLRGDIRHSWQIAQNAYGATSHDGTVDLENTECNGNEAERTMLLEAAPSGVQVSFGRYQEADGLCDGSTPWAFRSRSSSFWRACGSLNAYSGDPGGTQRIKCFPSGTTVPLYRTPVQPHDANCDSSTGLIRRFYCR